MSGGITLAEGTAPGTPSSGYISIYPKSDGLLYWKDDAGVEYAVGYGGLIATPAVSGRLTLTSATPVLTASVTGATTVYFTPYKGNTIPIYSGSAMVITEFTELSQATTDTTKSPAAVANNSNYDVFVWNDSGTLRATRGPAWTSDTARGTGAGTTELELVKGIYVNKIAITNGPAAQRGTYVGSIRSNGSAQIDWKLGSAAAGGGEAWLGVWNMYNRVDVVAQVQDSVDSYTYQTSTWRAPNGSTTNRVSFINGLAEDGAYAMRWQEATNSASSDIPAIGIGLDTTSTNAGQRFKISDARGNSVDAYLQLVSDLKAADIFGFHYVAPMENVWSTTAACTFYGDSGGALFRNMFSFKFRM